MAALILSIEPGERGFDWRLLVDDQVLTGTSPAEHICLLDAREALKGVRDGR